MGAHLAGTVTVTSLRGSTMHGLLCDAFMMYGGFFALDGELFEILTVGFDPVRDDAFAWITRRASYEGAA